LKEITDRIGSIKTHGQSIELTTSSNNQIKIMDLVPEIKDDSEYYHYLGSLTTPLCNPVVSWHVLKDKKTVSSDQISKLATMEDAVGHLVNDIYRTAQTNQNTVYQCPKPKQ
jgi:carbonic anhydrase